MGIGLLLREQRIIRPQKVHNGFASANAEQNELFEHPFSDTEEANPVDVTKMIITKYMVEKEHGCMIVGVI